MLIGDRRQHLLDLQAKAAPTDDEQLLKVYETHRLFGIDRALDGLRALSLASCSTNVEEQGHAATSCLTKGHSECGSDIIQSWSLVRQCRALVSTDRDERIRQNLERRIHALSRKTFSHFTGRQLFLRHLNNEIDAPCIAGRFFLQLASARCLSTSMENGGQNKVRGGAMTSNGKRTRLAVLQGTITMPLLSIYVSDWMSIWRRCSSKSPSLALSASAIASSLLLC